MTQGIILAGGYSSRIGQNKMTLSYLGIPLIHHCIQTMMPFVSQIFVITGYYHDELLTVLHSIPKVTVVYNELYNQGMFSSVIKGANFVTDDFFIIPGDYPTVSKSTYDLLQNSKSQIAVPVYQGKKGHPIFIKKELIQDLRNEPLNSNLKQFRNRHSYEQIEVNDSGILNDIDTIEDHQKLINNEGVKSYGD